jgi:hypothetical protein
MLIVRLSRAMRLRGVERTMRVLEERFSVAPLA